MPRCRQVGDVRHGVEVSEDQLAERMQPGLERGLSGGIQPWEKNEHARQQQMWTAEEQTRSVMEGEILRCGD